MKRKKFNFYKELPPDSGCRACNHNSLGVCDKIDREIPFTYALQNRKPKWCPIKKESGGNVW